MSISSVIHLAATSTGTQSTSALERVGSARMLGDRLVERRIGNHCDEKRSLVEVLVSEVWDTELAGGGKRRKGAGCIENIKKGIIPQWSSKSACLNAHRAVQLLTKSPGSVGWDVTMPSGECVH